MATENNNVFHIRVFDEFHTGIVDSKFTRKRLVCVLDELKEKFG